MRRTAHNIGTHRSLRQRSSWTTWVFVGIASLMVWGTVQAAPVLYRYPLGTASNYTTYRDKGGSGRTIDWNGGKFTYNGHEGTDFALPKGSPIYAAADGVVEEVVDGRFDDCRSGACASPSNRVRLKHADGQVTYYLHMKKFSIVVKKGQTVKCGQKLGEVASSGRSTGNHLHFQVGAFRASKEPFKGSRGATSTLWTSQGGYARRGVVPGSKCHNTKPECTKDSDCKVASKPVCSSNACIPRPPATCPFVKTVRLQGLTLRMRAQSNTTSGVVGQVPEGTCLAVIKSTNAGQDVSGNKTWYQVRYSGATGWVSGAFADCSTCGGECANGAKRSCYTGAKGTAGKGLCKNGTQTCSSKKWGSCAGQIVPTKEVCSNNKDEDCNGKVDDGCAPPVECKPGETRTCDTKLVVPCKAGKQSCDSGKWSACTSNIAPSAEICDGKDNNCDGLIDEGCPPPDTCDDNDGDGWGRGAKCTGQQDCDDNDKYANPGLPERCDNNKDDDCDGKIDENCAPIAGCEDKDGDGYRAGSTCPAGIPLDCDDSHKLIHPGAQETCGNSLDEDCDNSDLPCKAMGTKGCTNDGECQTRFCFKNKGESACSKPCTNGECPAGFTCIDKQGCWPDAGTTPAEVTQDAGSIDGSAQDSINLDNGLISIGCKVKTDCPVTQVCVNFKCILDNKQVPSGCNAGDPITPFFPVLLLLGLLALLRRREQA